MKQTIRAIFLVGMFTLAGCDTRKDTGYRLSQPPKEAVEELSITDPTDPSSPLPRNESTENTSKPVTREMSPEEIAAYSAWEKMPAQKPPPCRPLSEKHQTGIQIGRSDADAFWKNILPPEFAKLPRATDRFMPNMKVHEFKQTHAHLFWKPYEGKKISVSGTHFCPCCFEAPIGYLGRGFHGWVILLDDYIAIGLPETTTRYTLNGKLLALKGALLSQAPEDLVTAVGLVEGPHSITNDLFLHQGQAHAYYVLEQDEK